MPVPMYNVIMTGTEIGHGRPETERRANVRKGFRSPVVFVGVCLNLSFVILVLLVWGSATKRPWCDDYLEPAAPVDKTFQRHGSFHHHEFTEDCSYDHLLDVLIIDLMGDGFGENATLVYDFRRGLMAYDVPRKDMCLMGVLFEQVDVKYVHDGDVIELPDTSGRNYTSTGLIPSGFLQLNASPVVVDLCKDRDTHWIEPSSNGAVHPRVRAVRNLHPKTTTTTTTTTTSDGSTTTTTTTTTVHQK